MGGPIRVLLADDHAILRSGVRALLAAQAGIEVVGEAADFDETRRLVAEAAPDVVVLDLSMPGGAGLRAIAELRDEAPRTRLLVLTMHDDPTYARTALAAGASGYLVKSVADQSLIAAIRSVHRGGFVVELGHADPEALPARVPVQGSAPSKAPLEQLSPRERQVMIAVAGGHTNREVAEALGLSVKTVESYRARLMAKLGIETRAELTRLAIELGLLAPDGTEAGSR